MTWTENGYRHAPCVACEVAVKLGLRNRVQNGRCHIRGVGDVCGSHYHILMEAFKNE